MDKFAQSAGKLLMMSVSIFMATLVSGAALAIPLGLSYRLFRWAAGL